MSTRLYSIGVYARCISTRQLPISGSLAAIEVDVFKVESVDVSWEVTEDCETDVDKQISAATCD